MVQANEEGISRHLHKRQMEKLHPIEDNLSANYWDEDNDEDTEESD